MDHRYPPPHHERSLPPSTYPQAFSPQPAQPLAQIPFSDPFQTSRDPFLPNVRERRPSFGINGRPWPPATQGNGAQNGHQQASQQSQPLSHSSLNGTGAMPLPYDPSRRRSLSGSGAASPPQYALPHQTPPHMPHSFQARNMPPPSPPQLPPSSAVTSLPGSAPRGPPTASPFAGVRDLAGYSSGPRSGGGMSISSILGGEERKPAGSPHGSAIGHSPPSVRSMQPPSPGRARASSMREGFRPMREASPSRGSIFGEPRSASAALGLDRLSEPRREPLFGSPQLQRESAHSFRAFQPTQQPPRSSGNGIGIVGRPSSQPSEAHGPRSLDELTRREVTTEPRHGIFRNFGDHAASLRSEPQSSQEHGHLKNGTHLSSHQAERQLFQSPQFGREMQHQTPSTFRNGIFGTPQREEQAASFRPSFQPQSNSTSEHTMRESIETRPVHDVRRDFHRVSPTATTFDHFERGRNNFTDRPLTFEEHQRLEMMHRDPQRKESEGSITHRMFAGLSPELNRKGRNSPLPQAVQGVQPKHVGPGGDNPGIKMEFGRMFSGLGSGVGGSQTPVAGQSVNGTATPSRMSPARHVDDGNLVRTAVDHIEESRSLPKSSSRGGRKGGRRSRDDMEKDGESVDGRRTPSMRGGKRAKANNNNHHYAHLQHDSNEHQPSPFSMLRFPSNQSHSGSHHHHAHPSHHHHAPPRAVPAPRKPTTTTHSQRVLDAVAEKPRKHLGSHLYTTKVSLPSPEKAHMYDDAKLRLNTAMKPIPYFEGRENCTYTVRVPRYYLERSASERGNVKPSELEMICRRRQLWGTELYSDDSDVVAAAVHSGWLKGDFGEWNDDIRDVCDNDSEVAGGAEDAPPLTLSIKPKRPVRVPANHDAHITLLILPPLDGYASTNQHHLASREWKKEKHDGMSFTIHRIDFVDEGPGSRFCERSAQARKARLAAEEAKRREAAAGLLMFAASGAHSGRVESAHVRNTGTGASAGGGAVSVGA